MLRALYAHTMALAAHPKAIWLLAMVAFVESSVFPIPPDVMLIPMVLSQPRKAWFIALVATIASVLGGLFGYWIGAELYDTIGVKILELYGKADDFAHFKDWYHDKGAWAVLFAGLTPFPFKVITIASGLTALPLNIFITAAIIARGLRFFIVAALLWRFGAPIQLFIEKRLGLLFTLFCIALLGGFAAIKLL